MTRVLLPVMGLVLAGCCPAPRPTACPPCKKAAVKQQPKLPPRPVRRPAPDPPVKVKPARTLSTNCQAPLALTEAVSRLLIKAAAHSTSSGACIDASGTRVAVDKILVCPKDVRQGSAVVEASYRVGRFPEGDTRMCRNPCEWIKPTFSEHLTTFHFKGKAKVLRIQVPAKVPGFDNMTPLSRKHSGGCYGESGPFVPMDVKVR